MSRALLILSNDAIRAKAVGWIRSAPVGCRVEFKEPTRTLDQNSLMWLLLTKVSEQCRHHGVKLPPDSWRFLFIDALTSELQIVPSLDGQRVVPLRRTSDLTKGEMSALIELIYAWGASKGVQFEDEPARQLEAAQ